MKLNEYVQTGSLLVPNGFRANEKTQGLLDIMPFRKELDFKVPSGILLPDRNLSEDGEDGLGHNSLDRTVLTLCKKFDRPTYLRSDAYLEDRFERTAGLFESAPVNVNLRNIGAVKRVLTGIRIHGSKKMDDLIKRYACLNFIREDDEWLRKIDVLALAIVGRQKNVEGIEVIAPDYAGYINAANPELLTIGIVKDSLGCEAVNSRIHPLFCATEGDINLGREFQVSNSYFSLESNLIFNTFLGKKVQIPKLLLTKLAEITNGLSSRLSLPAGKALDLEFAVVDNQVYIVQKSLVNKLDAGQEVDYENPLVFGRSFIGTGKAFTEDYVMIEGITDVTPMRFINQLIEYNNTHKGYLLVISPIASATNNRSYLLPEYFSNAAGVVEVHDYEKQRVYSHSNLEGADHMTSLLRERHLYISGYPSENFLSVFNKYPVEVNSLRGEIVEGKHPLCLMVNEIKRQGALVGVKSK